MPQKCIYMFWFLRATKMWMRDYQKPYRVFAFARKDVEKSKCALKQRTSSIRMHILAVNTNMLMTHKASL